MDNSGFRPPWFDKSICYKSIVDDLASFDRFIILFDGEEKDLPEYINHDRVNKLECFNGGSDAHSYKYVIEYIKNNFDENDIIYIVEDDYLHKPGWSDVLRTGAEAGITEYWTLYDHPDKYLQENVSPSYIYNINYNYWRTATSTTNTVAFRVKSLINHWETHWKFCDLTSGMTWDHAKFLELKSKYNASVSYPIPGYSTHCDNRAISHCVTWEKVIKFYE